jgi:hypothetical protein
MDIQQIQQKLNTLRMELVKTKPNSKRYNEIFSEMGKLTPILENLTKIHLEEVNAYRSRRKY